MNRRGKKKTITRREIKNILEQWQDSKISVEQVYQWANSTYLPLEVDFEDWENKDKSKWDSVARDVITYLEFLPRNLIVKEDAPIFLEFLSTPIGRYAEGRQRFLEKLDDIDYNSRAKALINNRFYEEGVKRREMGSSQQFRN